MSPDRSEDTHRVVCWFAGLTTLDVVHRAAAPPTRNAKVTATRQDVAAGGPAANAAVTAAALGVRAVLVTALGQGPVAAAARADLESHGVEILDTAAPDFPLAVSAVLVDERTGERSVVSADGALATAPAPPTESLHALPRPDAVLFDGHHPEIARAVLTFVQAAKPRPHLLLDAGRWRPIFAELLPHADVAALSDDFRIPTHPDLPVAEAALTMGATAVVITHGPAPVEWHRATTPPDDPRTPDPRRDATKTTERSDDPRTPDPRRDATKTTERRDGRRARGPISPEVERPPGRVNGTARTASVPPRPQPSGQPQHPSTGHIDVPHVDPQDTLGAGDAFHGALTAAVAQGHDLQHATETAVRVASTRVGVVGPREWLTLIR